MSLPAERIVRRKSGISGWGVYATGRITKNTRIIDYIGERISRRECGRRDRIHMSRGRIWCFIATQRTAIDGSVGGNLSRFINHACRPNCHCQVIDGTIRIRASRSIAAGEELTLDYNTGGAAGISCRCRPGCRTRI